MTSNKSRGVDNMKKATWKGMALMLLLLGSGTLTAVSLSSCASVVTQPQRPAGCEGSLIYNTIPNPELLSTGLILGVYEYAKLNPDKRALIEEALICAEELLEREDITAADGALLLTQRFDWLNKYLGAEILILTELLSPLNQPIPLDACDRRFLQSFFKKEREYISML